MNGSASAAVFSCARDVTAYVLDVPGMTTNSRRCSSRSRWWVACCEGGGRRFLSCPRAVCAVQVLGTHARSHACVCVCVCVCVCLHPHTQIRERFLKSQEAMQQVMMKVLAMDSEVHGRCSKIGSVQARCLRAYGVGVGESARWSDSFVRPSLTSNCCLATEELARTLVVAYAPVGPWIPWAISSGCLCCCCCCYRLFLHPSPCR